MASWALTTLCTTADVRAWIASPEIILQSAMTPQANVDQMILGKITLAKNMLYKDLLRDMKQRVPELVDTWVSYKRWQINNLTTGTEFDLKLIGQAANLPNVGGFGYGGTTLDLFYFLTPYFPGILPQTYISYGTPINGTSGTWANTAKQGSWLIDTLNWALYINSGSLASPTWVTPTAERCLDNLLNPSVLNECAVAYTLWFMAMDGMFRNRVNYDDATAAGFMVDTEAMWRKRSKELLLGAIPLLQIDLDGDGEVSNFERSLNHDDLAMFG